MSDATKVQGYFAAGPTWPFLALDALGRIVIAPAGAVTIERWTADFTGGPSAGPILVSGAGPCAVFQAVGRLPAAQPTSYFQLFDSAAAPVLGAVPLLSVEVQAGETFGAGGVPTTVANALYWAASSTAATYTPAGAGVFDDVTVWWSAIP